MIVISILISGVVSYTLCYISGKTDKKGVEPNEAKTTNSNS